MSRILAALIALAVLAAACSTGTDAVDQTSGGDFRFVSANKKGELIPAADRKSAPTFEGTTLEGGRLRVTSLRGKVVLLNFWGSWCAPCRAEMPDIQRLYRGERARGLRVLGVDVKDQKQLAASFVRGKHITYPSMWDPDSRIALAFRGFSLTIPSTILIDRKGRVAGVYVGALLYGDYRSVVDPLLGSASG